MREDRERERDAPEPALTIEGALAHIEQTQQALATLIARVAEACPEAQITDAAGASFAVAEMARELDRVEARVKVLEERQERAVDVLRGRG